MTGSAKTNIPILTVARALIAGVLLVTGVLAMTGVLAVTGVEAYAQSDQETLQETLAANVPIWVAELDASTLQQRRQAENRLIEAGPDAADYVPVVLDQLSIDAQQRLQRIQDQWRSTQTREEVRDTVVKLQETKTLGEALEAISLASGVEFDTDGRGQAIDLNQTIKPPPTPLGFWQAIDQMLDQTELDIDFYGGDRDTLALTPRGEQRLSRVDSAAYAGIYRLEPTIVTARRVLGAAEQSGLNLTVSIAWQPNRTPVGLSIPIKQLSGLLDNATDLEPQASGDSIDIATSTEIAESSFFLPMKLPDRRFPMGMDGKLIAPAKEIVRVSGVLFALLPGERREFELNLTEVAAEQTFDAMTVMLEAVRHSDPLHEIRLAVNLNNAGRSLESHRQWIYENEAYVLLPDGTRQDHLGYEVFRQSADGIGIGYLFDLGGNETLPPGTKVVYESPTSVVESEVPFILNGIPLP